MFLLGMFIGSIIGGTVGFLVFAILKSGDREEY